ncbi:hypothetical protein CC80DRAFT_499897 [Byssothecium circinans]|uniref:Uncharacterized protein n=1 Tax=Byssothecium circinans TaxID=147558 RepID=A0A6A5UFK7_9PLEO|nr:hypothetical protein CC80DRAFT_499897 [Byssothecium circinans]
MPTAPVKSATKTGPKKTRNRAPLSSVTSTQKPSGVIEKAVSKPKPEDEEAKAAGKRLERIHTDIVKHNNTLIGKEKQIKMYNDMIIDLLSEKARARRRKSIDNHLKDKERMKEEFEKAYPEATKQELKALGKKARNEELAAQIEKIWSGLPK